jgi:uncharacterized protein involved in exopolysaccharide biosynthesis
MRTFELNSDANSDEMSIGLVDVVQFIKRYYKSILSISLTGWVCAIAGTFVLGNYTANASLQNMSGVDIPSLKYLQSALPKLEQENQEKQKDRGSAYLGSDQFWVQSINPLFWLARRMVKTYWILLL